jgi:hypothetical protein
VQGVLAHFVRQEIRAVQFVPELMKAWTNLLLPNLETLRYDRLPKTPSTPRTLFNVDITNQRLYAARTLSLSALKKLGKATGTTLNDVVLAVCSGALRDYLLAKDALPAQPMTTMVPVSARGATDADSANQNSMFVCSIASDLPDAYERLLAIHESALEQKKRLDNVKNLLLPDLAVVGQGGIMRHLVELYGRAKLAQRLPLFANLTISNIPGPPIPLYLAGLRVLSLYPCSIPFHGTALNITVQSYGDRLDFGLIACRRTVPDLPQLADGLSASWNELQQAVWKHLAAHAPEVDAAAPQPAAAAPSAERVEAVQPTAAAKPADEPSSTQPAAAPPARSKGRARKVKSQPPAAPVEPAAARRAAKPARSREAAAGNNGHANGVRTRVPLRSDIVALRPKRGAEPTAAVNGGKRKKTAAVSGDKPKKTARPKRAVAAQDA